MPETGRYPGSMDFSPALEPGMTARLFRGEVGNCVDVFVQARRFIGVHRHDFGSISATTLGQDCQHLDLTDGELGQYRYVIRGNFEVQLAHPIGVDQYRTDLTDKNTRGEAWRMVPWANANDDPEILQRTLFAGSEFFVLESETPRFDIFPFQPGPTQGHIDFYCWQYSLSKAADGQQAGIAKIWVGGWPSGKVLR